MTNQIILFLFALPIVTGLGLMWEMRADRRRQFVQQRLHAITVGTGDKSAPRLSLHVHDTRGLGVANVLVAYEAGVTRFDGSAGGLGGCPFAQDALVGNIPTEVFLEALEQRGGIS